MSKPDHIALLRCVCVCVNPVSYVNGSCWQTTMRRNRTQFRFQCNCEVHLLSGRVFAPLYIISSYREIQYPFHRVTHNNINAIDQQNYVTILKYISGC